MVKDQGKEKKLIKILFPAPFQIMIQDLLYISSTEVLSSSICYKFLDVSPFVRIQFLSD